MNAIKISKREAAPFVSLTFPKYRGRKFRVVLTEKLTFYDTNWSGGTRNQYGVVSMKDGKHSLFVAPAPWVNVVEGQTVEISPDLVIVEHSVFCGEDMGIRLHAHPSRGPKFLHIGDKENADAKHI